MPKTADVCASGQGYCDQVEGPYSGGRCLGQDGIRKKRGFKKVRQIVLQCFFIVVAVLLSGCDVQPGESSSDFRAEATFDHTGTYFSPARGVGNAPTQLVYVPVYSRLFLSKASFWEMAASLSIRNTDPDQSLIIHEIDYIDTGGDLLEHYLETPHQLDPMATVTLTLPQWDMRGGTGANFLVRWSGEPDINDPIIEVVMAGTRGTQSFSFIRAGQEVIE